VSWQLAAFTVLFLALGCGFAWYEQTRPDARIVALVATLAAFAALGRIAFAALPNVKPTTDIVLISGFALGAAPGFVVGALAALTSNFFFGQGPWTPWQMAAWGAAGLIGAALGAATGRRLGRWPLAAVCMAVGFAFTATQDVGDWVSYSDHSLGQLGIYVGKGLGFDAVHAAGCAVFALLFGPALARSLGRFAARLRVVWRMPGDIVAPLLLVALILGGAGAAHATSSPAGYLLAAQNADGGFGAAPGQASGELFSGWAALGLGAEGYNPAQVSHGGRSLLAYLRAGAGSDHDPGSIERTILAAAAAGADPHSFGGRDLIAALEGEIRRDGSVSRQTNLTAFAVLALRAAGVSPSARTLRWLVDQEDRDGGFNFSTAGGMSDPDDTGAVLEALAGDPGAAATRARRRAVSYLGRHEDSDGGFAASPGAGSNAQSTAWAVQGLIAAGANPSALHRHGAPSPISYLESLIASDGHVRYSRATDQTPVWVTAEVAMALAGKPLPLAAVALRHHHAAGHAKPSLAQRDKTVHRVKRAHVRRPRPRSAHTTPAATMNLASDAGILDAVLLAPIGVG
jgi:energy-coupling factor transport system substrate-specific component